MSATDETTNRRFGRIYRAIDQSGLSRSALYGLAAENPGLFLKFGSATIVDLIFLDNLMANLPAAQIGKAKESEEA